MFLCFGVCVTGVALAAQKFVWLGRVPILGLMAWFVYSVGLSGFFTARLRKDLFVLVLPVTLQRDAFR